MSLYLWVNLLSFAGPFFLSFDKKVHFYTHWKSLIPAVLAVGFVFILWDFYYTEQGIWGFNPEHLSGVYLFNLPLEECLFFFTIPYASVFIYEVLKAYFPSFKPSRFAYYFSLGLTIGALVLAFMYSEGVYSFYGLLAVGVVNWILYFGFTPKWYPQFISSFIIVMIPFLVVNGILTGAITEDPIVWYNEKHITGIKIYTIPIEDVFYNFLMLLSVISIHEFFKQKVFKVNH